MHKSTLSTKYKKSQANTQAGMNLQNNLLLFYFLTRG